jgi:hypothetical protein
VRMSRSAGKRFGGAAIGLAVMASFVGVTAAAETQCQWQTSLLNLAGTVLTKRTDLPPLQARNFGAEAAFLDIRSAQLDKPVVEALLDQFPIKGSLDAAWLFLFRDLSSQVGAARVRDVIDGLSVNVGRYGIERTGDLLDRIIALDALTPYLTGASATLPADLSADFAAQWPHWVTLVEQVKANPDLPSSADDLDVITELLFAGGQMDALAALLGIGAPRWKPSPPPAILLTGSIGCAIPTSGATASPCCSPASRFSSSTKHFHLGIFA